jgi:cytochrome c oxidase cbb3-type subunit 2
MYDYPFQWGSKRTGPDLARLGGKYSDEWHTRHLINPRDVVKESIMPGYKFLVDRDANILAIGDDMTVLKKLGVPYNDEMIQNAVSDAMLQASTDREAEGLIKRYGKKVNIRDFDGNPQKVSEMDALVSYLQMLGTLVDFTNFEPIGYQKKSSKEKLNEQKKEIKSKNKMTQESNSINTKQLNIEKINDEKINVEKIKTNKINSNKLEVN